MKNKIFHIYKILHITPGKTNNFEGSLENFESWLQF